MSLSPSFLWRVGLALLLGAAIIASAAARAPGKPLPRTELKRVVLGSLALYAVGLLALLMHRSVVAILVFAAGISVSALAAWLSRGDDAGGGPPRGDEPVDEEPPSDPDGRPAFDWAQFEHAFRAYADRSRDPVSTR